MELLVYRFTVGLLLWRRYAGEKETMKANLNPILMWWVGSKKCQSPQQLGSLTVRPRKRPMEPHSVLDWILPGQIYVCPHSGCGCCPLVAVVPSGTIDRNDLWVLRLDGTFRKMAAIFKNHPVSSFPRKLSRRMLRRWVPTLRLPKFWKEIPFLTLSLNPRENNLKTITFISPPTLRIRLVSAPVEGTLSMEWPYFDQHIEQKGVKKKKTHANKYVFVGTTYCLYISDCLF